MEPQVGEIWAYKPDLYKENAHQYLLLEHKENITSKRIEGELERFTVLHLLSGSVVERFISEDLCWKKVA